MRRPSRLALGGASVLAVAATAAALVLPGAPVPAPAAPALTGEAALLVAQQQAAQDAAALGDPITAPDDWSAAQRLGGGGMPAGAYERAVAQTAGARDRAAADDPALAAARWAEMGPTNVGGRVADLAVDPEDADVVYAGTSAGGVWRSTDGGVTFARAWDPGIGGAIGALAIGSDGVLWAGTGESNPGGGGTTYPGSGLYRSADEGKTWQRVGLPASGRFGRIVVDPTDPRKVWAAASGTLYSSGGQRGLYLTEDAGRTWKKVLDGDNATTGAVDVALQPGSPGTVLATMWDHERTTSVRRYGGPGSGLYRSTDSGRSWTRLPSVAAETPEQTGRLGVAFSDSDPQRAYAVVANRLDGTGVGLWRSDDGGATWARTAPGSALSQSSYGWWFGRVTVDPDEADRVFVGGLELQESSDGGRTFLPHSVGTVGVASGASIVAIHSDQQAMAWAPSDPTRAYLGNDGGVYASRTDGRPGSWVGAVSQGWTQHYSVDVSRQDPSRVVSGLQDNLCQRNHLPGTPGLKGGWSKIGFCGDGVQTLIDPKDDSTTYSCSQYGSCSRNTHGVGGLVVPGSFKPTVAGPRYGWWAPVQFDPTNSSTLYYGGTKLARSTDRGSNWTAVSPDLTGAPANDDPNPGYRIYGTITTVAAAASDPKRVYVGTDAGLLWTTPDVTAAVPTWTRLDQAAGLPTGRWVTRVTVDPADARTVYVTYSGYRNASDEAHVFRSRDGGATFTDLSGDLPDAPVNEIVLADGALVVGTDTGVFLSREDGRWLPVGDLPVVPVFDIDYHAPGRLLTVATFGYGVQRLVLPSAPAGAAAAPALAPALLAG